MEWAVSIQYRTTDHKVESIIFNRVDRYGNTSCVAIVWRQCCCAYSDFSGRPMELKMDMYSPTSKQLPRV